MHETRSANNTNKTASHSPSEQHLIEPLFNEMFIRIFGSERSRNLTRSLVNAVLGAAGLELIGEIDRIDAEHSPITLLGSTKDKRARMDVRIVASRRVIDLEAQRYPEDIENRSLFYASQLISANTPLGSSYKDMPQAVIITLLDSADMFPDSRDFISTATMRWNIDDAAAKEYDGIVFVLVELGKFRAQYPELNSEILDDILLSWCYLLTNGYRSEEETMEIAQQFNSLEEFAEFYGLAANDPKVIRQFEDIISAEREYKSRMDYFDRLKREGAEQGWKEGHAEGKERGLAEGRAEGREQGLAEGRAEGRAEGIAEERERLVAALRASGVSEEQINAALKAADNS